MFTDARSLLLGRQWMDTAREIGRSDRVSRSDTSTTWETAFARRTRFVFVSDSTFGLDTIITSQSEAIFIHAGYHDRKGKGTWTSPKSTTTRLTTTTTTTIHQPCCSVTLASSSISIMNEDKSFWIILRFYIYMYNNTRSTNFDSGLVSTLSLRFGFNEFNDTRRFDSSSYCLQLVLYARQS